MIFWIQLDKVERSTLSNMKRKQSLFLVCVALPEQIFSGGVKVIEHILFVCQYSFLVPFFSIFTGKKRAIFIAWKVWKKWKRPSAANVCKCEHDSKVMQKHQICGGEIWLFSLIKPAIAIQNCWILWIEFDLFGMHNKHWHLKKIDRQNNYLKPSKKFKFIGLKYLRCSFWNAPSSEWKGQVSWCETFCLLSSF